MSSFSIATKRVTEPQFSALRIGSNPGVTKKEATDATNSGLLADFRGCDWTIPVEVQPDKKARIAQRSLAEILVALPTLTAASIFARYISGDGSKPIEWWVIPAVIGSLTLIALRIRLRIKLDETK